jgi:glutamate transport system substrate-binding protein
VQAVDFAGPYLQSPEGLLVRKGGPYDYNDPSIDHARICTIQGSAADQIPLPNPQGKSHGTTYADCVNLLEAGKVDAVITGWLVLYGYVQSGVYPNLDVVLTHYGDVQDYGIGLPYGDRAACVAIARFLTGYVGSTQWADDLQTNFSGIAKNYPGPRTTGTDWRDPFMPTTTNGYQANCE